MTNQMRIALPALLSVWLLTGACNAPEIKQRPDQQVKADPGKEHMQMQNTADTAALHAGLKKCYVLHASGEIQAAINCYETILPDYRVAGYTEGSATIFYNLFQCYWQEKDFTKSEVYLDQFKSDLKRVPSLFFNPQVSRHKWLLQYRDCEKVTAYYQAGNFDSAVHLCLDVISRMEPADSINVHLLGMSYATLGAMYGELSKPELALNYFDKMETLGKQFSDTPLILKALNNKASLWINNQETEKALHVARAALKLARSARGDLMMESTLLEKIALILIEQQKPEEALTYSKNSLSIAQRMALKEDNIEANYLLGYNYNQLKDYKKAESYLLAGLQAADAIHFPEGLDNAYEQLVAAYEGMGDYARALHYKTKYSTLKDSLQAIANAGQIANAETRYRVARKDKALAEKDKVLAEQKTALYQQRYWLTGSIGGGLILLLFFAGFLRNARQKRKLHKEQLQSLRQQKKIEHLQVKMEAEEQERKRIAQELHDGLGVLLSAAKINHAFLGKVAADPSRFSIAYSENGAILKQMQEEVTSVTNNLIPDYITHKNFEDVLADLSEKFHRPGKFHIYTYVYGTVRDLHPDRSFSLYRVLEEIIHNAVKHAGGTELVIQLIYHKDQLRITIEDNGTGFDVESSYTGMGLHNIKSRVSQLNGTLNLTSGREQGTTYTLEIPY